MTCPGCKKDIPDNSIVCPECNLYILIALKNQKDCPYCAERIEIDAYVCKHCKRDLTKDARQWWQKKRFVIPLIVLEFFVVALVTMALQDFGSIIQEFEFRNNRLEIVGKMAEALDAFSQIDSLQKFEYTDSQQINIEFLIFSYDKISLQLANYSILKYMAPSLKKEGTRIKSIKISANTPTGGQLSSVNSVGDIVRIDNGTWEFADWLQNTQFQEKDIF